MSTYGSEPSPAGDPYGQAYGRPHGQTYPEQSYGQQPQQSHGQQPQPYGQAYPQQAYGGYGAATGRPGGVVTAAVLGFIWGALGVLVTVGFLIGGAVFGGSSDEADEALPGLGGAFGAAAGIMLFFGALALAWTVVMIWGSVWALTGRSRVLLLVGGSIAIACTGLMFVGGIASVQDEGGGGVVLGLIGLVVSILIVVLLSTAQAAAFFAAGRARTHR